MGVRERRKEKDFSRECHPPLTKYKESSQEKNIVGILTRDADWMESKEGESLRVE